LGAFLQSHPLQHLYGGENAFLLAEYTGALREAGFTIRSTLRPLESPINYFPHTQNTLREEMIARVAKLPGIRPILGALLASSVVFARALALLAYLDSRPGRLYSFICDKAEGDVPHG